MTKMRHLEKTPWLERAEYDYLYGVHRLILYGRPPDEKTLAAITQNPINIGYLLDELVILMILKIEGATGWLEAPYSIHRLPSNEQVLAKFADPDSQRAPVEMELRDPQTRERLAGHTQYVSPEFTSQLHTAIMLQAARPFSVSDFEDHVQSLRTQFTDASAILHRADAIEVCQDQIRPSSSESPSLEARISQEKRH